MANSKRIHNTHKKWHFFYPPIHIIFLIIILLSDQILSYVILVPDNISEGSIIFNATLTRLHKNRIYSLNTHKNGYFVKKLLGVDRTSGEVFIKEKLDCQGIWYPNLFTLYVDSFPEKLPEKNSKKKNEDFQSLINSIKNMGFEKVYENKRHKRNVNGVKYYSMPLRIFIYGKSCNEDEIIDNSPTTINTIDKELL